MRRFLQAAAGVGLTLCGEASDAQRFMGADDVGIQARVRPKEITTTPDRGTSPVPKRAEDVREAALCIVQGKPSIFIDPFYYHEFIFRGVPIELKKGIRISDESGELIVMVTVPDSATGHKPYLTFSRTYKYAGRPSILHIEDYGLDGNPNLITEHNVFADSLKTLFAEKESSKHVNGNIHPENKMRYESIFEVCIQRVLQACREGK